MEAQTNPEMRREYATYKEIVEERLQRLHGASIVVGIGSGRTARNFLDECVSFSAKGPSLLFAAASTETEMELQSRKATVVSMQSADRIDIYFDGADYVDGSGWMVKGYGGAVFLESIAMQTSSHSVIAIPQSKCVESFQGICIPVEVVRPSLPLVRKHLEKSSCTYKIRSVGDTVYTTSLGNIIVDVMYKVDLPKILDVPGVVACGLIPPSENVEVVIIRNPLY
ncbi:ribose 5-phosphate isomerase A [Nematocida major]|uniref:ribose 5-phosphate isomerase A n=1 Tax=Nematocida major TaxID=1912982 RepID=UPI00200740B6|nr:ribose 5-phosphate isomerase A [Nematocida major]KAH9386406.1 ribose 5-phosphate isomerase A [Nematocida major]